MTVFIQPRQRQGRRAQNDSEVRRKAGAGGPVRHGENISLSSYTLFLKTEPSMACLSYSSLYFLFYVG